MTRQLSNSEQMLLTMKARTMIFRKYYISDMEFIDCSMMNEIKAGPPIKGIYGRPWVVGGMMAVLCILKICHVSFCVRV